jgi:hypothetical protein
MELKLKKKEKSPLCNAVQKLELLRWVILFLSTLTQGMDGGFLDEAQLEMDFCKESLSVRTISSSYHYWRKPGNWQESYIFHLGLDPELCFQKIFCFYFVPWLCKEFSPGILIRVFSRRRV